MRVVQILFTIHEHFFKDEKSVYFFHTQLSYGIGIAEPLSIAVDTYSTGRMTNADLKKIIGNNFDLRPGMIIRLDATYFK